MRIRTRFRNILLLTLVLAVLAPAAATAQEPPMRQVFLPLVHHDTTCPTTTEWVSVEDPGIYFFVGHVNTYCPAYVYQRVLYIDNHTGEARWTSVSSPTILRWWYMPFHQISGGQDRTNLLMRFSGLGFTVRYFTHPQMVQLYGPDFWSDLDVGFIATQ